MATNKPTSAAGTGGASGSTPCTGDADCTSAFLGLPAGMVPVTAMEKTDYALSMTFRTVPLGYAHRWRDYPEKIEVIPFLEWCQREVKRLHAVGRKARVITENRSWYRVCYVAAVVPPRITLSQKLKEGRV